MEVTLATSKHVDGLLHLAAEVEPWFGQMVEDPDFHSLLHKNIGRATARIVCGGNGVDVLGGLLTGGRAPTYQLNWLVVTATARGRGIGTALVRDAFSSFGRPCRVDVITFGRDHPAAQISGGRVFYERLGFEAGEQAPRGPEGGSRQWYHLALLA